MGARRIPKNQREIERLLKQAGLKYRIDCGLKHRKLFIGDELALVFSHGGNATNDLRQIMSLIHRATGTNADPRRAVQGA